MRTISDTVHIDASPEQVWQVLTDTGRWGEWNTVMPTFDGTLSPGDKIKVRVRPPGGPALTARATVEDVRAGERLSWRGGAGLPGLLDGHHEFVLSPSSELAGGTRLVQSETFTGALVPVAGFLLTRLERGYSQMDRLLKDRVETRRTSGDVGR